MSDRMKLMLASLTIMMLPYHISFPLSVLIITAILSTAIAVVRELWAGHRYPTALIAAPFLYHSKISSIIKFSLRQESNQSDLPSDISLDSTRMSKAN